MKTMKWMALSRTLSICWSRWGIEAVDYVKYGGGTLAEAGGGFAGGILSGSFGRRAENYCPNCV